VVGRRGGVWGWVGLGVYVGVVDWWLIRGGRASLSEVFRGVLGVGWGRVVLFGLWGVVSGHLFGGLLPGGVRVWLGGLGRLGGWFGGLVSPEGSA